MSNQNVVDVQRAFLKQFHPHNDNALINAAMATVLVSFAGSLSGVVNTLPSRVLKVGRQGLRKVLLPVWHKVRPPKDEQLLTIFRVQYDPMMGTTMPDTFKHIVWYITTHKVITKGRVTLSSVTERGGRQNSSDLVCLPADHQVYDIQHQGKSIQFEYRPDTNRNSQDAHVRLSTTASNIQPLLDFLRDIKADFEKRSDSWEQHMYTHGKGTGWIGARTHNRKTLDKVVLSEQVHNLLIPDVQSFFDSKEWYTTNGIPWKRGYLLEGAAGCGKTSLVMALSFTYEMDLYMLNLTEVADDRHLNQLFNLLPEKCMLVLEDVDCMGDVVHQRAGPTIPPQNKKKPSRQESEGISLSALLNCLDGVSGGHGRVTMLTTNHKEVLDSALIRAGRADLHVTLTPVDAARVKGLHKVYFEREPTPEEHEQYDAMEFRDVTPASIASAFLSTRLYPQHAVKHLRDVCGDRIVMK